MYEKLVEIRNKDLPALANLNAQISQIAKSGSPSDQSKAEEKLKKVVVSTKSVDDKLTTKP
jgi:hypothetical protein